MSILFLQMFQNVTAHEKTARNVITSYYNNTSIITMVHNLTWLTFKWSSLEFLVDITFSSQISIPFSILWVWKLKMPFYKVTNYNRLEMLTCFNV